MKAAQIILGLVVLAVVAPITLFGAAVGAIMVWASVLSELAELWK